MARKGRKRGGTPNVNATAAEKKLDVMFASAKRKKVRVRDEPASADEIVDLHIEVERAAKKAVDRRIKIERIMAAHMLRKLPMELIQRVLEYSVLTLQPCIEGAAIPLPALLQKSIGAHLAPTSSLPSVLVKWTTEAILKTGTFDLHVASLISAGVETKDPTLNSLYEMLRQIRFNVQLQDPFRGKILVTSSTLLSDPTTLPKSTMLLSSWLH
ncbi:hypothetical protein B0A48_02730 [Cryoendolithus antarcticus]|uniref:Uncharacterized protein n=1 Tax=Cryoendolithus antarcticus TaxID=1507870 RepID=A0A1V8TLF3_9PEZI|nr:hypothetical protein B0A48_02730 [Cryoendolithus antarcticus]